MQQRITAIIEIPITTKKKLKLSTKITYGWKSVCKICIIYGILFTDLYPYI